MPDSLTESAKNQVNQRKLFGRKTELVSIQMFNDNFLSKWYVKPGETMKTAKSHVFMAHFVHSIQIGCEFCPYKSHRTSDPTYTDRQKSSYINNKNIHAIA